MKHIFIVLSGLLFFNFHSFSQTKHNLWTNSADSLTIKAEKPIKKHFKHRKFLVAVDTLTQSDYLLSIDRVNDKLIDIRDSAKLGFEIVHIKQKIDNVNTEFNKIQFDFKNRHLKISPRNLTLYKTFISQLDEKNDNIIDRLQTLYKRVYHARLKIKTVFKDSVFRRMYNDSILRNNFDSQLFYIERKWNATDSLTKLNTDSINSLKIKAIDNSISLTNLLSRINRKIERADKQLFSNELPPILRQIPTDSIARMAESAGTERNAFVFYISETSSRQIRIIIGGLLLFLWLLVRRKLLRRVRLEPEKFDFLQDEYLTSHPTNSLLLVFFVLVPLFNTYAPISYLVNIHIVVLLLTLRLAIRKIASGGITNFIIFSILFSITALVNLFLLPVPIVRLLMILTSVTTIWFSVNNIRITPKNVSYGIWKKISMILGILFASLAVVANITGRYSLSMLFSLTSAYSVTLIFVLPIAVRILQEMVVIQLLSGRLKKGVDKPFDVRSVRNKIRMPLMIIMIISWLISISSSLNIYISLLEKLNEVLTAPRFIGSISFQLSSVILFFLIIWLAHILQRLISYLFGETGIDAEDNSTESKNQNSRLLILRLMVLIAGYLLAIAASGLPVDKLTFLLGALGVGIGMGLQNIVNNFVSGIILIFDGSLKIGDEIEISGQSGKVKEIGLRSSTLNTNDGAEVIIPNGTILSQNIVNWTYSNDQKRVTISFALKGEELDANEINEIINETIKEIQHVNTKRKSIILYNKVTNGRYELTVRFWSTISKVEQVKSDAIVMLNTAFSRRNIGFE